MLVDAFLYCKIPFNPYLENLPDFILKDIKHRVFVELLGNVSWESVEQRIAFSASNTNVCNTKCFTEEK